MTTPAELKPVHYPGNITEELTGRIMGWAGRDVVIVVATFDPDTRRTTAWWRPCLPGELDERVHDGFGRVWLPSLAPSSALASLAVES